MRAKPAGRRLDKLAWGNPLLPVNPRLWRTPRGISQCIPRLWPLLLVVAVSVGCADVGTGFPDSGGELPGSDGIDTITPLDATDDTTGPEGDGTEGDATGDTGGETGTDAVDGDASDPPDTTNDADLADSSDGEDDLGSDTMTPDVVSPTACAPCLEDEDCNGETCVPYGNEGFFCGGDCVAFVCSEATEGASTECKTATETGVCVGVRACVDGELTACSADAPAFEVCDGLDNDCDGQTDEGFPNLDGDADADCVDLDDDDDTIADTQDNCPLVVNPNQDDLDDDQVGDACDPDIDGDGSNNEVDCAPTNPDIAAGTQEVCNGEDDDCDGQTDEANALGCITYYPDEDSDLYGAEGGGACLCAPTVFYKTSVGGDCNDTTSAVNPMATEVCDALDNDCNGGTDEPDSEGCTSWFFDNDGDGYHIALADEQCLCGPDPILKYTADKPGECDDNNASIYPTALEICDGADDNCDNVQDDGCDDDEDGYCDGKLVYSATGIVTCPKGGGDCDDDDADVHPGAAEVCDGKDTNCFPDDDVAEGTAAACGPFCAPCPDPPAGAVYTCSSDQPDGECLLACSGGKFCADCTCDGAAELQLGEAVTDAKVLYDPWLDTFRVAYFAQGSFRLRAISPTGAAGNDVIAVAGVTKWTGWDVTQISTNGRFVFAWTAYPDSSIRIGVANVNGTQQGQFLVVPDVSGVNYRQNVAIGWHAKTKTHLVVWDETTSLGLDVRGTVLDQNQAQLGNAFQVVGGSNDQIGTTMGNRGGDLGYLLGYATDNGTSTTPAIRFFDHTGGQYTDHPLSPAGKPGNGPEVWYDPVVGRGLVQWLGSDDQYHLNFFGPSGVIGDAVELGGPAGGAFGAPSRDALQAVYLSGGAVRMRTIDKTTGTFTGGVATLSETTPVNQVVGGVAHPLGYGLVLWTVPGGLRGRLVAP